MRRFFPALVLFQLLLAQTTPGVCAAAAGHSGAQDGSAARGSAAGQARQEAHDHAAAAPQAHHHVAAAPQALEALDAHVSAGPRDDGTHGHGHEHGPGHVYDPDDVGAAGAQRSPAHDGSCADLMRCHWTAVPAADATSLAERAARAPATPHARDAHPTDAPALLTPPPRRHS